MNITVVSGPAFEPVTLAEVYKQLRIDPDDVGSPSELSHPDDSLLEGQIATAREFVESATRRSMIQRTLRISCAGFPRVCYGWRYPWPGAGVAVDRILLLRPPIIRVESVRYYDADNALQTVDAASYYWTDDQVPELRFVSSFSAPTVYDRPDAVRVDYVAGYTPSGSPATTQAEYAANVPLSLRNAVLIGVQLLYDNLAPADRAAMEALRESLIQPLRIQLT